MLAGNERAAPNIQSSGAEIARKRRARWRCGGRSNVGELWLSLCVMITIGIKGREEAVVLPELTAKHIGSGTVPVLATPMMIALMEKTCRLSVKPYLEEGQETVGQGTHERFIIDENRFRDKMNQKSKA